MPVVVNFLSLLRHFLNFLAQSHDLSSLRFVCIFVVYLIGVYLNIHLPHKILSCCSQAVDCSFKLTTKNLSCSLEIFIFGVILRKCKDKDGDKDDIFFHLNYSQLMKRRGSSSKKKKINFIDDRSGQQTATPRVKKSYSVTTTNYLQLQIDTSSKKRQNMERVINTKDKRIHDLQRQVKEQQDYITNVASHLKQYKHKYETQRHKNQRIQSELRQAVELCRAMKEKCRQLMTKNQSLLKAEETAKQQAEIERKKFKDLKEVRRREKKQLRDIFPLLIDSLGKGKAAQIQAEKYSKLL